VDDEVDPQAGGGTDPPGHRVGATAVLVSGAGRSSGFAKCSVGVKVGVEPQQVANGPLVQSGERQQGACLGRPVPERQVKGGSCRRRVLLANDMDGGELGGGRVAAEAGHDRLYIQRRAGHSQKRSPPSSGQGVTAAGGLGAERRVLHAVCCREGPLQSPFDTRVAARVGDAAGFGQAQAGRCLEAREAMAVPLQNST